MRSLALAALAAAVAAFTFRQPPREADSPLQVRRVRFEGAEIIVASADMRRVRLRMLSRGPAVRSLADAESVLHGRGERVLLVTNGGLFHDQLPIGLHVEDGRTVTPLRPGSQPPPGHRPGNFYYLPNAVLFQDRTGGVAIRESSAMQGREGEVRDGLQSGPALLLEGRVHRVAAPSNTGYPHERRSVACIPAPGRLVMVLAVGKTTFPQLTRYLRDELGCRDAVFLDANVPGLRIPEARIRIQESAFAGVLALTVAAGRSTGAEPLGGAKVVR